MFSNSETSHTNDNQARYVYTYEVTISTCRNQEPNTCVEDWNIEKSQNVSNRTGVGFGEWTNMSLDIFQR